MSARENIWVMESNKESTRELLRKATLDVQDEQLTLVSNKKSSSEILRKYNVTPSETARFRALVKLKPCVLTKPFWKNPRSLYSLVSLTIVPIGNEYICAGEAELVDLQTSQVKKFSVEQKYVLSFGIISSIFVGIATPTVIGGYKDDMIEVLLNGVVK